MGYKRSLKQKDFTPKHANAVRITSVDYGAQGLQKSQHYCFNDLKTFLNKMLNQTLIINYFFFSKVSRYTVIMPLPAGLPGLS